MASKPLIFISFQPNGEAGRTLRVLVGSVATEDKSRKKARMSGIGLGGDETHKICEAAGVEAEIPPTGGAFMGIARTALPIGPRGPEHPRPAQSRGRGAQTILRKLTVLPRIGAS
jgi:hypothetical protein